MVSVDTEISSTRQIFNTYTDLLPDCEFLCEFILSKKKEKEKIRLKQTEIWVYLLSVINYVLDILRP